jgi:4-diphosphocytidyl-2-C-methyl-D-erythritol kinase
MTIVELAPAKVNLDLLVTGRTPHGYHELDSLVVFADLGDRLTFRAAPTLELVLEGPFAAALQDAPDNLVLAAARRLAAAAGVAPAARITLEKVLPVASGIGGGSADAAATLRGLARLWRLDWPADRLRELGLALGADVPVCVYGRPARLRGIGERLDPIRGLPDLPLVLVNPGSPGGDRRRLQGVRAADHGGPPARAAGPPIARPLRHLARCEPERARARGPGAGAGDRRRLGPPPLARGLPFGTHVRLRRHLLRSLRGPGEGRGGGGLDPCRRARVVVRELHGTGFPRLKGHQ